MENETQDYEVVLFKDTTPRQETIIVTSDKRLIKILKHYSELCGIKFSSNRVII